MRLRILSHVAVVDAYFLYFHFFFFWTCFSLLQLRFGLCSKLINAYPWLSLQQYKTHASFELCNAFSFWKHSLWCDIGTKMLLLLLTPTHGPLATALSALYKRKCWSNPVESPLVPLCVCTDVASHVPLAVAVRRKQHLFPRQKGRILGGSIDAVATLPLSSSLSYYYASLLKNNYKSSGDFWFTG